MLSVASILSVSDQGPGSIKLCDGSAKPYLVADSLFLPSLASVACASYTLAVFILDSWTRHDITLIVQ